MRRVERIDCASDWSWIWGDSASDWSWIWGDSTSDKLTEVYDDT